MKTEQDNLEDLFRENRKYFIAFGDHRRQEVLIALWNNKDTTVKELAQQLGMPRPSVSHHIKILREAGLLQERKDGVKVYYRPSLKFAVHRLRSFLDTVDKLIEL